MTTREIGAYECGKRLGAYWLTLDGSPSPDHYWVIQHMAEQDSAVFLAMKGANYWYWFDRGWDATMAARSLW